MTSFFSTILAAFTVIMGALALLAIGWLLTGKSRLELGACGRDPTKKKDGSCGSDPTCSLCKKDPRKDTHE